MAQEQAHADRRGDDEDRGGEEKSEYERRGEERSDYERGDENKVGQDDDGHLVVQVLLSCLAVCAAARSSHPGAAGLCEKGAACRRLKSAWP